MPAIIASKCLFSCTSLSKLQEPFPVEERHLGSSSSQFIAVHLFLQCDDATIDDSFFTICTAAAAVTLCEHMQPALFQEELAQVAPLFRRRPV